MFWYLVETILLVAALFGCFVLGWKLGWDQRRDYERERRRAR